LLAVCSPLLELIEQLPDQPGREQNRTSQQAAAGAGQYGIAVEGDVRAEYPDQGSEDQQYQQRPAGRFAQIGGYPLIKGLHRLTPGCAVMLALLVR
jgi:hypothetical protein